MEAQDLAAHSDHDILAALRAVEASERNWEVRLHLGDEDRDWRALGRRTRELLEGEARRRGLVRLVR